MLLTRGILYTAMTRAKELLILVGDDQVVARMAANDRQQRAVQRAAGPSGPRRPGKGGEPWPCPNFF